MRASHFAVAILSLGNMTSLSVGTASPEGAQPPAEQQARQRADELVKQLSLSTPPTRILAVAAGISRVCPGWAFRM